jgi:D-glycero-alpha-D-manno-heptose-7-phosphate kinase
VDQIFENALSAGALGGKLTGAGGGGFLLLFVPPSKQRRVRERLNKLIHVPFKFEFSGSQIIFFDQEQDYSAEEKVRAAQMVEAFRELEPAGIEGGFGPPAVKEPAIMRARGGSRS